MLTFLIRSHRRTNLQYVVSFRLSKQPTLLTPSSFPGFAYFAPTIIKALGYSTVQTQLHTVPPVAAALVLCIIVAYLSDLHRLRSPYILGCTILTLIGLALLISIHNFFSVQYLGIHLVSMGAFAAGPIVVCWYVMNLQGHAERSIGSAWMIGFGNTGGIVATFTFLAADAPKYTKGYTICLAVTAVGVVAGAGYAALVWRDNKAIRRGDEGMKGRRLYAY